MRDLNEELLAAVDRLDVAQARREGAVARKSSEWHGLVAPVLFIVLMSFMAVFVDHGKVVYWDIFCIVIMLLVITSGLRRLRNGA